MNFRKKKIVALNSLVLAIGVLIFIALFLSGDKQQEGRVVSDIVVPIAEEVARPKEAIAQGNGFPDHTNVEEITPPHSEDTTTEEIEEKTAFSFDRSLDEFHPAGAYLEYLDAANSGDTMAQHVLLVALSQCSNIVTSEKALKELSREGYSESLIEIETSRFRKCKPLLNMQPNIQEEYERRYQSLREIQSPLLELLNGGNRRMTVEQMQD